MELIPAREDAVEAILEQIEFMFGPMCDIDCVVEGDNDRGIMAHNVRAVLDQLLFKAGKVYTWQTVKLR